MKIVARGTLNPGEAGTDRAVGTFPKLLVLKDGTVPTTCKVRPNVHVRACVVSVAIDSMNRVLHYQQGNPGPTRQLWPLLQASSRVVIVVRNS